MEIKAQLNKPYTDEEKFNFIVENNHNKGYEIRETESALQAWGDTEEEALQKVKQAKHAENLQKAYEAEENGAVLYKDALFETSTANTSKLSAQFIMIQSGLIETVQWLSKDDKQVELTGEDIATLGAMIAEHTGALWNVHYLAFKEQIDNAETVEEVNEIVIDYETAQVVEE